MIRKIADEDPDESSDKEKKGIAKEFDYCGAVKTL